MGGGSHPSIPSISSRIQTRSCTAPAAAAPMEQLEVPTHRKIRWIFRWPPFFVGDKFSTFLYQHQRHWFGFVFFSDGGPCWWMCVCESDRVIFLVKLGMVQLVFCFLFGWKSRWPAICDNHWSLLYELLILLFACWIFNLQILRRWWSNLRNLAFSPNPQQSPKNLSKIYISVSYSNALYISGCRACGLDFTDNFLWYLGERWTEPGMIDVFFL